MIMRKSYKMKDWREPGGVCRVWTRKQFIYGMYYDSSRKEQYQTPCPLFVPTF